SKFRSVHVEETSVRTARFIGSWVAGLIALTLAVTLFVQWLRFALGAAEGGMTPLFLWMAFGVNLLVWTVICGVRLGDDTVRGLAARRAARRTRGRRRVPLATEEGGAVEEQVLVRSRAAGGPGSPPAGGGGSAGGGGTGPLESAPETGTAGGTATAAPAEQISMAVIIPAHNEEPVIDGAIASALRLFNRWDIYVVSDSSHDATADIAAETGVNVLELLSNRGKAGAIEAVITEFDLTENYDAVVILDADTELDEHYVEGARRQLAEQDVAAVAGFVVAEWKPQERTLVG